MNSISPGTWLIRRVALVSTGSEILQGQYADSNARYLAEAFTLRGITVTSIIAAPDDEPAIEQALLFSAAKADLIISTGGLGPTRDDLNRFVFERLFEAPLKRDETAIDMMARRFVSRGLGPLPGSNEVQAQMPEGCIPLYNRWGTAPGFVLLPTGRGAISRCGLLALPGPPSEMVPMFNELALQALEPYLPSGRTGIVRTIHTYGHPESELGNLVADLFKPADDIEFSILAKVHGVDFRIRAFGDTAEQARITVLHYEEQVLVRLQQEMVYGVDDDTLPEAVGRLLKQQGKWVATAESCTGGMIAQMLTEVPGSSAYVGECHVTYSNAAKQRVLGVKEETLKAHGAVSEETAREMAEGVRRISGADWGISVTGIAGPDSDNTEKPVGLTYIALASAAGTAVHRFTFTGDRSANRLRAAQSALNLLRLELLKN